MCLLASGLGVVQQAMEVSGNKAFRGRHNPGIIMLSANRQRKRKRKKLRK